MATRTETRTESRSELRNRLRKNTKQQEEKFDIREKIILQCIISGVIFASVLLLNIISNDFTNNISTNLRTAINRNVTIEYITNSEPWTLLQNTVRSILGQDEYTYPQASPVSGETEMESGVIEEYVPTDRNFRINEELLGITSRAVIGAEEKKHKVLTGLLTL